MKFKLLSAISLLSAVLAASTQLASAHVIVTPSQAQTASSILFNVSVPNEKDSAMTGLALQMPAGVTEVMPTALSGWTVTAVRNGDTVSSVNWTAGSLPSGQRQDFTFSAQTPEKSGQLHWKAVQTFADGSTSSWDQQPVANEADNDASSHGPYSVTTVSAQSVQTPPATSSSANSSSDKLGLVFGLVALITSVFAVLQSRKNVRG